jgi:hypothetical protein
MRPPWSQDKTIQLDLPTVGMEAQKQAECIMRAEKRSAV